MKKFLKGFFIGFASFALPAILGGIIGYGKGLCDAEEAFQEQIDRNQQLFKDSLVEEDPAE